MKLISKTLSYGYHLFVSSYAQMSETAVLIINMQSARADPSSEYYLEWFPDLVAKTNQLLAYAHAMQYKVIFIQHFEPAGDFAKGKASADLHPDLAVADSYLIVEKEHISSYYQTQLAEHLQGIKNLVICGVLTNLCVRMCVEESRDRGFRIALLEDLTACFSPELQEMTLEDLNATRGDIAILPLAKFTE